MATKPKGKRFKVADVTSQLADVFWDDPNVTQMIRATTLLHIERKDGTKFLIRVEQQ